MAGMQLDIVTAERQLLSESEVESVVAPAADGEITILPHHASVITLLRPGELRVRRRGQETVMRVSGGFLEIHHSTVTVLAESVETDVPSRRRTSASAGQSG